VSPTEAGERLLKTVGPRLDEIEEEIAALSEFRDKPAGNIRITAADHSARSVLWPKLATFLPDYPDIKVEILVSSGFVDLAAERFDAGVRLGDQIAKDMIAVRIAPDLKMAVVATPAYFARRPAPQTPHELSGHDSINLRLATHGGLYAWEFEKDGHALNVRVEGQLTFNGSPLMLQAALDGFGLACVPEGMTFEHIAAGRLVRVLEDWCPAFPGYHLYYPSRRQSSPAFALLVEALRHRPQAA
jgi:DNA-binding transcriptional LysR family regulator